MGLSVQKSGDVGQRGRVARKDIGGSEFKSVEPEVVAEDQEEKEKHYGNGCGDKRNNR